MTCHHLVYKIIRENDLINLYISISFTLVSRLPYNQNINYDFTNLLSLINILQIKLVISILKRLKDDFTVGFYENIS